MTRAAIPLPRALPWLLALPFLAFQMARVVTSVRLGPGSSTEGLAYPFTVIYAGVIWLLAFGVVQLVRRLRPIGSRTTTISLPTLAGVLLIATGASWALGHRQGVADVSDVVPMVLVDGGRIEESALPTTDSDTTLSRLVVVGLTRSDSLTLGSHLLRVVKDTNRLILNAADGTPRVTIPLPALLLPLQVEVLPVDGESAHAGAFAFLVTGSMRSNQALLAVIDTNWALLYSERMYRRWPVMRRMLEVRRDPASARNVLTLAAGRRGYRLVPH